jgi:3-(3-hydroxy-phenyl)propionate hydroxylase
MALTALSREDARTVALRNTIAELLDIAAARRRIAGLVSGLDIHYDLGGDHPLVGRRTPDLDLATASGPVRTYTLLHDARPVLLNLGIPGTLDLGAWTDRVRLVEGTYDGAWELPVLGEVAAPTAVLVRPDGYVAWVGGGSDAGLVDALTTWFGPASASPRTSDVGAVRRMS